MGYACPVCGDPQANAGHLANHMAFTAILGDTPHETWLDTHAAGWGEMTETELAEIVADAADETDFPQVFEDTVGGLDNTTGADTSSDTSASSHSHTDTPEHDRHPSHHREHSGIGRFSSNSEMDAETRAILEEARDMTRQMTNSRDTGDESDSITDDECSEDDSAERR